LYQLTTSKQGTRFLTDHTLTVVLRNNSCFPTDCLARPAKSKSCVAYHKRFLSGIGKRPKLLVRSGVPCAEW